MTQEQQDYYICTRSGVKFSLSHPSAEDVRLSDIADALGNIGRFTGHAQWSVADHSRYVAMLAAHSRNFPLPDLARGSLAALLHDAHEAYMGDIATPVALELARMMGDDFVIGSLKRRIQGAIHLAFGLPMTLPPAWDEIIHTADQDALVLERDAFLRAPADGWGWLWPPHAVSPTLPMGKASEMAGETFREAVIWICEKIATPPLAAFPYGPPACYR